MNPDKQAQVPAPQNFDPMTGRPLNAASQPPTTRSRKWVKWLIVWLAAWLITPIFEIVMRILVPGGVALINIVSLLMGLYVVLGWIPMVIVMVRENKQ